MKHILENLKLFYINHGGQEEDLSGCTRIYQVLKKIASLPLGGGSNELVVEFSISEDQSEVEEGQTRLETKTSPQEIIEAYRQDKKIKAIIPGVNDTETEGLQFFLDNTLINDTEDKGFMWYASNVIAVDDGNVLYFTLIYDAGEEEGSYAYQAISIITKALIFEDNPYEPLCVDYTINADSGTIYCDLFAGTILDNYENDRPIIAKLIINPTSILKIVSILTIGSVVYNKTEQGQITSASIFYHTINYTGVGNDATYISVVHTYDYTTNKESIQYYDKKFTVSSNS